MTTRTGLLAGLMIAVAAGAALSVQAAETTARSRLCPEDAPEGVRLPPRPGCGSGESRAPKRADGFREILPGTAIRIGGRAGATFDARC